MSQLHDLLSDVVVHEPVACKFRDSIRKGWPIHSAKRTLDLVKDSACSSSLVEQSHGISSSLLNAGKKKEQFVLGCRMNIHQHRSLFIPSAEEKQVVSYMYICI